MQLVITSHKCGRDGERDHKHLIITQTYRFARQEIRTKREIAFKDIYKSVQHSEHVALR